MRVKTFVDELAKELTPKEFRAVCKDAKAGRMGFGRDRYSWGENDKKT